jgi:DNA-directed RNA polymerase specialized sigma24 family protein
MVPRCDDIPDFDLIRRMADEKSSFTEAREAWGRFYVRHHRFLLRVCMSDHKYVLGVEGVKDVVHHSFFKAFDGAKTFNHTEDCPADIQERKSRGWLLQIAENLVRDRFRNQPDVSLLEEGDIEQIPAKSDEEDNSNCVPESERLKLLISGFAILSDIEQTILRATMFWWRADRQHQRMPNTALLELSRQTGKSPENIRQIRLRAADVQALYSNSGPTVVATFGTGVTNPSLFLYEYRGASTSSAMDSSSTKNVSDTSTPSSGSANPTSSVELVFGALYSNPFTETPVAGSGFTLEATSSVSQSVIEDENIYITGPVSANWTYSQTTPSSSATVVTFK